ncbi:MAG: hypothetical protein KGJ78_12995 [Alphaproteobacteria bacterium]|nr:hypothetical protein [Alphaproteobacteria bacterium]
MRILMAAALAAVLLAPALAQQDRGTVGTWYGEGQPGDPDVKTVEHHMADGRYSIRSVKCDGDQAETSYEEGTWSTQDGLTVVVTTSIDGKEVHLIDKYKDVPSEDGATMTSTLVESSYPGSPIGYVFVVRRVADDFDLPSCGTTTS